VSAPGEPARHVPAPASVAPVSEGETRDSALLARLVESTDNRPTVRGNRPNAVAPAALGVLGPRGPGPGVGEKAG
jgi:hypothetical protein